MTTAKLRQKIKIKMIRMGLDKSGSQNAIAKRIGCAASAVSMALSGYQDKVRIESNTVVLRKIEEALDNWNDSPSVAA